MPNIMFKLNLLKILVKFVLILNAFNSIVYIANLIVNNHYFK